MATATATGVQLITIRLLWGPRIDIIRHPDDRPAEDLIRDRALEIAPGFRLPVAARGILTAEARLYLSDNWQQQPARWARIEIGTYFVADTQLVDTQAAAEAVRRPPSTIRRWALEGLLTRQGTDRAGRALYLLHEVHVADTIRRASRAGRPPTTQDEQR